MALPHIVSGIVLGLTAGVAPGPLLALVIAQSLAYGIGEGVKVAVAPLITDLPIIVAAFFIGLRLADAPMPFGLLSIAGAVYVGYLAWESITIKPVVQNGRGRAPQSMKRGILTNFLNPHPYLFWITVGTPLLHKSWTAAPIVAVLWLIGFYTMLVGTKVLLAILVGHWRKLLQGRAYLWINRALGLALVYFSVVLLKDGLHLMGL